MPIKLNSTGGGSVTLDVPSMSTANTLVLPAKSGNIITSADSGTVSQTMLGAGVAGNGPAFSAYVSSTQSFLNNTWVKVQYNTEEFDTASCYDPTTNYRFTPNVAGYYQVNMTYFFNGYAYTQIKVYKNGSGARGGNYGGSSGTGIQHHVLSALIYMNGTTDYLEGWAYQSSGSTQTGGSADGGIGCYFQAFLARAA